jgi:hypothetical protein
VALETRHDRAALELPLGGIGSIWRVISATFCQCLGWQLQDPVECSEITISGLVPACLPKVYCCYTYAYFLGDFRHRQIALESRLAE